MDQAKITEQETTYTIKAVKRTYAKNTQDAEYIFYVYVNGRYIMANLSLDDALKLLSTIIKKGSHQ